jgi:LuxR family transcriptional regulator, maltose regulon positive regulatory protein
MPSILAARRQTPDDRAPMPPSLAADRGRVVSLVVVRDGVAETFVLGTGARDALGSAGMAATPLDRVTGPEPLLSLPASDQLDLVDDPALGGEASDSLLAEIVSLLPDTAGSPNSESELFHDELTSAEARVLRYLPTNLTAWEIGEELYVSLNTVKTHMRHIYAKLGAHRRREAVERACTFGLLPPSSHKRLHRQALA